MKGIITKSPKIIAKRLGFNINFNVAIIKRNSKNYFMISRLCGEVNFVKFYVSKI